MNVLVPFGRSELGGSQLSFLKLADQIHGDDCRFTVWLFEPGPLKDELERRGIEVAMLPRSLVRTPWGFARLVSLLKRRRPDVIYLHASRVVALAARRAGVPCLERINMTRRSEAGGWARFPWIDRVMTRWNTHVLAVSEAIKQQLVARGIPGGMISVIRNGVDVERFQRPDLRLPTRRELGIRDEQQLIVNIGRCVPQKGQQDFIRAAALLKDERPDWTFLIVGEGPLESELKKLIEHSALQDRCRLIPFRKDIEGIYAAADMIVHCAHWEPLANVLLEARAAGLPIVATDVDGSNEALQGYDAGLLCPPHHPEQLARTLLNAKANRHPDSSPAWRQARCHDEIVACLERLAS